MCRTWRPGLIFVLAATASFLGAASRTVTADVLHVPDEYPTIQAGINAAVSGDTVLVSDGRYTGVENRNLDFGGRLITVVSENGSKACVIDCEFAGRGFTFQSGESADAVIEGFAIINGLGGVVCANSSPTIRDCVITGHIADYGAGIDCFNGSPTIVGCTIENNTALFVAGGINCNTGSSPTIMDSSISYNSAPLAAGGISCNNDSDPMIVRCTISHNDTGGSAGGIASGEGSSPTIDDCLIAHNTAVAGAGIDCYNSSPTILNSIIEHNVAVDIAGGINCKLNASPTIRNCVIRDNEAVLFNGGGIICNLKSNALIEDCTIADNRAVNGGGLYLFDDSAPVLRRCTIENNVATEFGGGVVCAASDTLFENCLIQSNTAAAGAGIGCGSSSPTIINSIIRDNVASQIAGGVLCNDGSVTLINCLLTGNSATFDGGAVYNYNAGNTNLIGCTLSENTASAGGGVFAGANSHPELRHCVLWNNAPTSAFDDAGSNISMDYCDIQGGWSGTGNISSNPEFVAMDDFRLSADSPCIDAGDPGFVPQPNERDLDGHARVLCGRVDMGAYEFGIGDFDCDRDVDLFDFWAYLDCVTGPADPGAPGPGCEAFDGDADLDVDWADFAVVQSAFDLNP